jgi:hypothetical protein
MGVALALQATPKYDLAKARRARRDRGAVLRLRRIPDAANSNICQES